MATNFEPLPGEREIRTGRANLQKGIDHNGGDLQLTNQRLRFVPHTLDGDGPVTEIALDDIADVQAATTKAFGFIPIAANALLVSTRSGASHRILVDKRGQWLKAIEAARAERE